MKKGMADGVFPEIVRSAERHGMDIYCITLHLIKTKIMISFLIYHQLILFLFIHEWYIFIYINEIKLIFFQKQR